MLQELRLNLRSHGYVGDTKLPELCYLTLVSALLDQPVSLLIKGPASSGKSYALACAKRYVPDDAYEQFEAMSERSLAYLGEQLDLRHKTLIIQEAAGMAQGQGRVFLRQLLTEGAVRYTTVQSTSDGLQGVQLPPVQGPCGLVMTTTANRIHHEDESRMLSYHVSESPDHILAILRAMTESGPTIPTDEELEPFHARYQQIRENRPSVEVPFASALVGSLPVSHHRILRDFPKVISLIKSVALLHEDARDRGSDGQVLANIEDYRTVWELICPTLSQGLEAAVPEGLRRVVEAVEELTSFSIGGSSLPFSPAVSQRDIATYLNLDPSVVSRHVHRAIQLDYLIDDNPGQGSPGRIRIGEQSLPSETVLPSPTELLAIS